MNSPTFRALPRQAIIREMGLRDGLQSISTVMPTAHKLEWIRAAHEAGQREIEIGSFVPPRLMPQLADTAELLEFAKTLPGLQASVLVPNLKGAERAIAGDAYSMLVPLSASYAHSLANLRKTPDDVVAEIAQIRAARDAAGSRTLIEVGISTAFGCTLQGRVEPSEVVRLVKAVLDAGVDRVGLADTVGYADPAMVRELFELTLAIAGDKLNCGHFHDTRGLGLANVHAALELGITRFDACLGGIGGCPHAPGASGNVATEDLAYMLASMGIETGQDFDALIALRAKLAQWLAGETLHGTLWRAGLPKTMTHASLRARPAIVGRSAHPPSIPARGRDDQPQILPQPLAGLRVIEFTHMVMGPTCGMVLADMGAEVIKIEPIDGDRTRRLLGAGAGFFPMFNRNKKSIGIDLHTAEGAATARRLCATADVVAENFKPGTMAKYGLDYDSISKANPRVIYASHKGFLPGPYDHRTALDEVVQMMGGLAYMTGRPGDPLRAGTSVNDIMGGLFGAIAVLGALIQRGITGRGMEVQSALYENNVFLMGQHMLQFAMTGKHPAPMPARDNPWAVYDVFTVKDGEQIFLAAVSDAQWQTFCDALGFEDLKAEPALATNNQRVTQRPRLLKAIAERIAHRSASDLASSMEKAGLPFAPIRRPQDLYDDEHLLATGGLADVRLPDGPKAGETVKTTLFPITMDGQRLPVRLHPPRLGEHSRELLASAGFAEAEIDALIANAVVA